MLAKNKDTIQHIRKEYTRNVTPWYLGFSGGKDSSALLKLVFIALNNIKKPKKTIRIVYCDTGVEIPVIRDHAIQTLNRLRIEANKKNIPIRINIVTPPIQDSFFVKVIGRGYPTPTNKFRWCTDRLRINPIRDLFTSENLENAYVLLGTRQGESTERDKVLTNHSTDSPFFFRQNGNKKILIYSPIIDYDVEDVWATLIETPYPIGIDVQKLLQLYKMANGECPIIRDPKSAPCGKGRFGCWTCTVVRKDKATQGLIKEGHEELVPLFEFRNWILSIRDNPVYRCNHRRNGQPGPGPFTLSARKEILSKLIKAQKQSGLNLITSAEINKINALWQKDIKSSTYHED